MLRCMLALPELRNELLLAAADLLARLPDDLPDVRAMAIFVYTLLATRPGVDADRLGLDVIK